MQWRHCACGTEGYFRVQRSWWMPVLFGSRRLYQCGRCGEILFLQPRDVPLAAHLSTQPPPGGRPRTS